MPGDDWQKFADLRAYFGFMWTHPGKKLLFMGGEIAQWREWDHDAGLERHLLAYDRHQGVQSLVRDLNRVYRERGRAARARRATLRLSLADPRGLRQFGLRLSAKRHRRRRPVLVLCNMTPEPRRILSRRRAPSPAAGASSSIRIRPFTAAPIWAMPASCGASPSRAMARRNRLCFSSRRSRR